MFTKEQIFEQLRLMGAPRDGVVIVHSSLRSVGEVLGGGIGLLDALIEYVTGEGGLLCIPTHTWSNLGKDVITLDMTRAESNLGALAVIAAEDKRGLRTDNPCHSMVIFGDREKAMAFAEGEDRIKTPTAPDSCYGKLLQPKGFALLVGVCQNKNTFLHTVDEILGLPNRMSDKPMRLTVKKPDGVVEERDICLFDTDYTSDISLRFPKYETAFRYHRCITDGFIGDAPAQLCSTVGMFETVKLIYSRAGGIDPLASEKPIPPKFYTK